jgi:monothiol glutaredoxin, grx4 family
MFEAWADGGGKRRHFTVSPPFLKQAFQIRQKDAYNGAVFLTDNVRNTMSIQEQIKEVVTTHPIVLFMKGTKQFPQCGFSSRAVQLLNAAGAQYVTVNVLENAEVRQGIKEYSDWPTIPQLYVNGEFVGGADILQEMYDAGELQELVAAK